MVIKKTTTEKKAIKKVTTKKTLKKEAPVKSENSLNVNFYTQEAKSGKSVSLPLKVFGVKWNSDLVHQVAVSMLSNKRSGTAHTKNRGEVSGGGKKPWKQKGTGRARHGSTRSPIWVGGGVTHGPRNEKDYSKKVNKKMKTAALFSVLSKKLSEGKIAFIDSINLANQKTKEANVVINALSKLSDFGKIASKKKTALFLAIPERNEKIEKAFRNIPSVTVGLTKDINVLDALTFNNILFLGEQSVKVLEGKLK